MFGGFGEPTVHPDILNMIAAVKGLGLRVEMVTNGTRLDDTMLAGLVKSGLDTLWVSFDGASEACFEGIREGADYGRVVASLRRLREMNEKGSHRIEVGIAFVVMKRNIEDLRRIDRLIEAVGASRVSVSNVLPYSAAMEREMVCGLALSLETFSSVPGKARSARPARHQQPDEGRRPRAQGPRQPDPDVIPSGPRSSPAGSSGSAARCPLTVSPRTGLLHDHTTTSTQREEDRSLSSGTPQRRSLRHRISRNIESGEDRRL
jgi:hypothetical protein